MSVSKNEKVDELEECKNVQNFDTPFHRKVCDILKPSYLKSSSDAVMLRFELSECHLKDLLVKIKPRIIMRFCLASSNIKHDYLRVTVNNNEIAIPDSSTIQLIDITDACYLTKANYVKITYMKINASLIQCVSISIAEILTGLDLCEKLKCKALQDPESTKSLIRKKLSDADNEISATYLKTSLICPIGKNRLNVPSRSSKCSHLQCFDALTYFQMNEQKPTWTCPICFKPIKFEDIIIDGLFTEILEKVKDSNEIRFLENGNWEPLNRKRNFQCDKDDADEKHAKKKKIVLVDLTGDSDEDYIEYNV